MILNDLGLLSKKKKVNPELTASIYVALLQNVIAEGFVEIKDFINNNNNLEENPNLKEKPKQNPKENPKEKPKAK